ncbi:hypothetical protein [Sediminibacterium soli]|uniref:hypothetical protein n=1 Tax=Sediminibacterium soli TaxID=2698829 RepID=UPI00137B2DAB|nr:hypothetical protein [Sediminibacterium soli]NCI45426.1 hypothetical protein [Sediminibacterium soli]
MRILKSVLVTCACLPIILTLHAQVNSDYFPLTKVADSLFLKKEYSAAVSTYMKAFEKNNGSGQIIHRYRAATCWAMLSNNDEAITQLERIIYKGKFDDFDLISHDISFVVLHNHPKWDTFMKQVQKNRRDKSN